MRYSTRHKEETRRKMLEAAGRGFRSRGYAGVGVDSLAEGAGVTSGAFYAHFGSKEGAFAAALEAGLEEVQETIPLFQAEHGAEWARAFATYYLGEPHRRDLECGCAMATLTSEVARFGPELHAEYEARMNDIVDLLARGLAGRSVKERRARAWSFLCLLIGGLSVARAVGSAAVYQEVAEAVIRAAVRAAGRTRATGSIVS